MALVAGIESITGPRTEIQIPQISDKIGRPPTAKLFIIYINYVEN